MSEKWEFYKQLGSRITAARTAMEIDLNHVYEETGFTPTVFRHIEHGTRELTLTEFVAICKCLHAPPNTLLGMN